MSRSETTFFVVKRTGSEYEPLTRNEIHARRSNGTLTDSQLVWHPTEKSWKAISSFSDLAPSTHSDAKDETTFLVPAPDGNSFQSIPKSWIRDKLPEDGSTNSSRLVWNPTEKKWKQPISTETKSVPLPTSSTITQAIRAFELKKLMPGFSPKKAAAKEQSSLQSKLHSPLPPTPLMNGDLSKEYSTTRFKPRTLGAQDRKKKKQTILLICGAITLVAIGVILFLKW